MAQPWQEFRDVGGARTELLGIDAEIGHPARLQVLVIPGNPGSAALYVPFMVSLHGQLGGHAHILAASHAGHDGFSQHGGQVWDLAEQVAHKVALLRYVVEWRSQPLLVVAHSIGATMMLKVLVCMESGLAPSFNLFCTTQAFAELDKVRDVRDVRDVREIDTLKLVAVFPFLEAVPESNTRQASIRKVASWHGRLGWLGDVIAVLPRALLARCLRATLSAGAAEAIAARLNRSTLRNAMYLATDEFKVIYFKSSHNLASGLGQRLHVMGCDEDTWLSRAQYEELRQRVPGLQATWHGELRHDFCVSEAQSRAVAEHVCNLTSTWTGSK
ncbi:hypothetical protein TSOC_012188 [Tetrabaena socialis]|uniref:Lipid droplet-associated hydrolase n=1 Tax=Tetrabaena socialis TaxID=47790 RepID=A0A2J7ZNP0_9CHLO|nr:hypothetical protein TSOC_012188 [Tetrabaena socialis]|eukprot:PNH01886.1 hypothetical protein TSOC_012188 [Tetrabaena socialis]